MTDTPLSEVARQRARVDALIEWTEDRLTLLNDYSNAVLSAEELEFPDPYPPPGHKAAVEARRSALAAEQADKQAAAQRRARAIVETL